LNTPAFEINGDIFFQLLSQGRAFLNGDLALKEEEVNNFVSVLLKNTLVFQAFHQHFPMHLCIRRSGLFTFAGLAIRLSWLEQSGRPSTSPSMPVPQVPPSNPTVTLHEIRRLGEQGVVCCT
jgi:Domain of Unknown Function (DUF1259)